MTCQGVVKSFNDSRGWGFIVYEGQDVFVHVRDCQGSKPNVGDEVLFDLHTEKAAAGQMKAVNVVGGTGFLGDAVDTGVNSGAGKGVAGLDAASGGCQGTVKSFNALAGWGFIDLEGVDVFCHIKDCADGSMPQTGDFVSFFVEESPSKPGSMRAKSVVGGTGQLGAGFAQLAPVRSDWGFGVVGATDKGQGKGKGSDGISAGTKVASCQGTVKSFSDSAGWGFILYRGVDVFCHIKDCVDGGQPQTSDVLTFDIEENLSRPGSLKAKNVCGGTGQPSIAGWEGPTKGIPYGKGKGKGESMAISGTSGGCIGQGGATAGSGSCSGTVKSFSDTQGWGFIDVEGVDVFCHIKDCVDGVNPQVGDIVTFDLEESQTKPGSVRARNMAGGTGQPAATSGGCGCAGRVAGASCGRKGGLGFFGRGAGSCKGGACGYGAVWGKVGPCAAAASPYGFTMPSKGQSGAWGWGKAGW